MRFYAVLTKYDLITLFNDFTVNYLLELFWNENAQY